MNSMIKQYLKTHRVKFYIGAPIIFLLLINSSGVIGTGNIFLLRAEKNSFPLTNDEFPVYLEFSTKSPINAVGGVVSFPPDMLKVESLSRISSSIDIWAEEPEFSNTQGTIKFSGGIIGNKDQAIPEGRVFVINFRVLKTGKGTLAMKNGQLLANDGIGTNIFTGSNVLTVYTREAGRPSPDINGDGVISASDVNSLYIKTFKSYDEKYDLNGDGKVSWADVKSLIALL